MVGDLGQERPPDVEGLRVMHQVVFQCVELSDGNRKVDRPEVIFTGLTCIGIALLHLSCVEVGLDVFKDLLDLAYWWGLEAGRAQPARIWYIDDFIPVGI